MIYEIKSKFLKLHMNLNYQDNNKIIQKNHYKMINNKNNKNFFNNSNQYHFWIINPFLIYNITNNKKNRYNKTINYRKILKIVFKTIIFNFKTLIINNKMKI